MRNTAHAPAVHVAPPKMPLSHAFGGDSTRVPKRFVGCNWKPWPMVLPRLWQSHADRSCGRRRCWRCGALANRCCSGLAKCSHCLTAEWPTPSTATNRPPTASFFSCQSPWSKKKPVLLQGTGFWIGAACRHHTVLSKSYKYWLLRIEVIKIPPRIPPTDESTLK